MKLDSILQTLFNRGSCPHCQQPMSILSTLNISSPYIIILSASLKPQRPLQWCHWLGGIHHDLGKNVILYRRLRQTKTINIGCIEWNHLIMLRIDMWMISILAYADVSDLLAFRFSSPGFYGNNTTVKCLQILQTDSGCSGQFCKYWCQTVLMPNAALLKREAILCKYSPA